MTAQAIAITVSGTPDGLPNFENRAWGCVDTAYRSLPDTLQRHFNHELPSLGLLAELYGADATTLEQSQRLAHAIEREAQARGMTLRVRVDTFDRPMDTASTNLAIESCWECGTEITPGTGILDVMGWAHRSCVGG